MPKKISTVSIQCLKEALSAVYWYKSDLRSFLSHTITDSYLVAQLNWNDYKRNIVGTLIDHLVKHEDRHQKDLLVLMNEIGQIEDFSHLRRLEDGLKKEKRAKEAVLALKRQLKNHQSLQEEQLKAEHRRETAYQHMVQVQAVREKLDKIAQEYCQLIKSNNSQMRGYALEKILKDLFELFDLDPKAAFKIIGEQLDGAFSFEGTDYLFEAKWHEKPVNASQIDSFTSKLQRKLDNTLGLFLSINGFSEEAIQAVSSGRRLAILMDGSDLMAVLEGRIDLVQLLLRKRRKAAETGNIYLRFHEF